MGKCEYETDSGSCKLNECMYGDFMFIDDSAFDSGRYCMCESVEEYRNENRKS